MQKKDQLRKKYLKIRKNKYFEVKNDYFKPLFLFLKKKFKKRKIYLSFYYPTNYEVNIIKFLRIIEKNNNIISLLPVIVSEDSIKFSKWNIFDTLKVNKYGMLEPAENKNFLIPDILLVPLLAFDKRNYRLGYGKGYYDRFLNKYLKINKNILTIGVAFSFQKHDKLPTSNYDVKLDYILTEKGMNLA